MWSCLLVFYKGFLFKRLAVLPSTHGADLDTVLGDDNGGFGRGPLRQGCVIWDIGPSDLFWNRVHYYYTRLSALSPLFDRLNHLALGFRNGLVC
jgi:hypothetical protein